MLGERRENLSVVCDLAKARVAGAGSEMRIGFLFNHDQVHQVAHSLPIALALAKRRSGAEIVILSASERIASELRLLGGDAIGRELALVELKLVTRSSRLANALASGLVPSTKLLIYRDNLDLFKSLDILVVPEKTSLVLKDQFHLDQLKIIHTRHGAGDRAIGFDKASARFDHILASGPKIRDRLVREAAVAPERISIVGYPKFDLFEPPAKGPRPRGARPLVLYNPHVAPHLSSWYRSGRAILRWFASNPSFRLIFAPHIMLFERRLAMTVQPPRIAWPGSVRQSSFDPDRVRVDTHSRSLTTMEYLNQADIYLGDGSSQIYEFLTEPRPCVFFNALGIDWQSDSSFAHWRAGRVIEEVGELGDALACAFADHQRRYQAVQEEMFRHTFELSGRSSSDRAADVILNLADERRKQTMKAARGPGRSARRRSRGAKA